MAFYDGSGANGLAVVVDVRSKFDHETDSVLREWALGRRALGRGRWAQTLKVALREYGSEPWTAKRVKEEKDAILAHLRSKRIHVVVPVQTPATAGIRQVHSSWNMFGSPGNPYKWAGTVDLGPDFAVAPILHPGNYEYVYGYLLERWLKQAHAVAAGKLTPMPWPVSHIHPGPEIFETLRCIRRSTAPVSIDIETNMAGTIVTAIGFGNEHGVVSVPWHSYTIAGTNGEVEPSLLEYPNGKAIEHLAMQILEHPGIPKILHNGTFDVLQLAKYGITLRGFEHDTLLMHRVVYPQFRHGLQQACATEFCVEPWKCKFKPPKVAREADPWLGCPVALREYNARDTYATWQLYQHLKGKLG